MNIRKILKRSAAPALAAVMALSGCRAKNSGLGKLTGAHLPDSWDSRMEIWAAPAYSRNGSKLLEMDIDFDTNETEAADAYRDCILNNSSERAKEIYDTFTYFSCLEPGIESKAFDDRPSLIPYYAKGGSDRAVIIIPGGGFGFKSINTDDAQGKEIAQALSSEGIHAFVLYCRTNPYVYPTCVLDLQRAVRYLRFQCEFFGFDPEKISLIGYGSGAYIAADYISHVQGTDRFPEDYVMDYMDEIDDSVQKAALISPVLSFEDHIPMLYGLYGKDACETADGIENLLERTDLSKHTGRTIPQMVICGAADSIYKPARTASYITAAQNAGTEVSVSVIEKGTHVLEARTYRKDLISWLKQ